MAAAVTATLLCAGVTILALSAPAQTAPAVLPDLSPQAPENLSIRGTHKRDGWHFYLGFRSASDNLGPGALIVNGARDVRHPGLMKTEQVVERQDGSQEVRPLPVELRYVTSPDHSHFHYPAFMRYELRDSRGHKRIGRDHKSGFCLGDRYETPPGTRLLAARGPAAYTGECEKGHRGADSVGEGISVGYGDEYAAYLEGQSVEVTGVDPGRYRLVHTVNPDRSLAERSYRNNSSYVLIKIALNKDGSPYVKVLSRH